MEEVTPTKGLEDPQDLQLLDERQLLEALVEQQALTNIMLIRIYDVAISGYGEVNPTDAVALAELHVSGKFRAPLPGLE